MQKALRFLIGVALALAFLWLALKNVSLDELRLTIGKLSYSWVFPFFFVSLLSLYLRAERWKQLIEQEGVKDISRYNLFSGVMLGYMVNYAIPRLGEVSRSVYVGNKEKISRSRLMGTVVLERSLDALIMLLLAFFVLYYIFSDFTIIIPLLDSQTVTWFHKLISLEGVQLLGGLFLLILASAAMLYLLATLLARKWEKMAKALQIVSNISKNFIEGFFSLYKIKNWPLFILLTAGIWICYILMTYIPFAAFNLQAEYGLGLKHALVITTVSAVAISLPAPGGIGTYHLFVSKVMLFLFAVPETTGAAYAIVNHFVMMIIILAVTPLLLFFNRQDKDQKNNLIPSLKKE